MVHGFDNNLKAFMPEFFLVSSILLFLLYGSFFSFPVSRGSRHNRVITFSSCLVCVFVLLLTCLLLILSTKTWGGVFNCLFICDSLSQNAKLFLLCSSVICLLYSFSYSKHSKTNSFEYYLLVLLAVLGGVLLCSTYDLVSMYLAVELQSLCLYVLATFDRRSAYSTESGLKYFILGSFSSGLLLFGISLVYSLTGSTNFDSLSLLLSLNQNDTQFLYTGYLFIASAFLFKLSAVPFHIWAPDIYEGAPLHSTVFFAIVPKLGLLIVLLRFLFGCFVYDLFLFQLIFVSSAFMSVLLGSFLALKQSKLKRLIAYSSISHVGYILFAFSTGCLEGLHSSLVYLLVYMLTSIGIWGVFLCLYSFSVSNNARTLVDLTSVGKLHFGLSLSLGLFLFSAAGVPPLLGFYSKFYVFCAAINSGIYMLSAVIILSNVMSTFYYIRLIKIVFFEKSPAYFEVKPVSKELSILLGVCLFLLVFLFFNPNTVLLFTYEGVLCLAQ